MRLTVSLVRGRVWPLFGGQVTQDHEISRCYNEIRSNFVSENSRRGQVRGSSRSSNGEAHFSRLVFAARIRNQGIAPRCSARTVYNMPSTMNAGKLGRGARSSPDFPKRIDSLPLPRLTSKKHPTGVRSGVHAVDLRRRLSNITPELAIILKRTFA